MNYGFFVVILTKVGIQKEIKKIDPSTNRSG